LRAADHAVRAVLLRYGGLQVRADDSVRYESVLRAGHDLRLLRGRQAVLRGGLLL